MFPDSCGDPNGGRPDDPVIPHRDSDRERSSTIRWEWSIKPTLGEGVGCSLIVSAERTIGHSREVRLAVGAEMNGMFAWSGPVWHQARYMDDLALWAGEPAATARLEVAATWWLDAELGLTVKPEPYRNRTAAGMDFLGCRVFPNRVTLNRRSRVRFRRKLVALDRQHEIGDGEYQQRATALVAFATAAGVSSWRTRRAAVDRLGESVERLEPSEPGRELERQRQELPRGEPEQELAGQPEQQPRLSTRRSSTGRADA